MPLFSPHLQGFLRVSVFSSLGIVFIWLDLLDELPLSFLGDVLPAVFLLPALVCLPGAWACSDSLPLCAMLHLLFPDSHSFLFPSFPCCGGAYLAVAFCEKIHRRQFF